MIHRRPARRIAIGTALSAVVALSFFACARPLSSHLAAAAAPLRLGADLHVHLTANRTARPLVHGEPGSGELAASPASRLVNQVDAAGLRASGTRLLIGTVWPPPDARPGRTALTETLAQVAALKDFTQRRPDFAFVTTAAQARHALEVGLIAVVPAIEGAEAITRVSDVDALYAAGVRSITLVHFVDNAIGGAAINQLSHNLVGADASGHNLNGLTELGQAAVERMFELGIIVDLAHASDATATAVLALAQQRHVPLLLSHAGARALNHQERNVADELAARIVSGGGMVGVTLFDAQVRDVPRSPFDGFVSRTCDDVIAHWLHLGTAAGFDALALGSDFNGFTVRPPAGGHCPVGLRHTGDLGTLYGALVEHGVPRESLDGMGERVLQLWERVERSADAAMKSEADNRSIEVPSLFELAQ